MRCPDEEIGRNSVSPCTMPMTRAWRMVSIGIEGRAAPRWARPAVEDSP